MILLIKIRILGLIPAFYDIPSQSYTFAQLMLNYPIISIISKTKGLMKKVPPTKVQSCSAHQNTSYILYPGFLRPSEAKLVF